MVNSKMPVEVYIDELFIGTVENSEDFINKFKKARREGKIPNFINIYYDEELGAIKIYTHKGRILRPLVVVEKGKPKLTQKHIELLKEGKISWKDLEKEGIIEWVDPSEEENLYVAVRPEDVTEEHTHLELSPLVIFSILTSLVPFSIHNQSVRLNRGLRTIKQALSVYSLAYPLRFDSDVFIFYYPQEPLVRTFSHDNFFKKDDIGGQNVVVAVMTQEGYEIEDALIINRGAIERGFARAVYFRPYKIEELKYPGAISDEIKIPEPDVLQYKGSYFYRHLEEDGIIYPEAEVKGRDILVGKVSPPRFVGLSVGYSFGTGLVKKDSSLAMRSEEEGIVDTVVITESGTGNKLIKIKVRSLRIPELGDKFSIRQGQKGVIGMIVDESEMPWTTSGIKPDVIFSPLGLPSRMTIGYLLEILAGKVGALKGTPIDGTPWTGTSEEELRRTLLSLGFREDGTETMYNPITGEEMKVKIFIGTAFYQRLVHVAANKLHARARGPVTLLTKQPTEGKAKEGGLRLGEMENFVLASHGAALLLRERFGSDDFVIPVCEKCGAIALEDAIRNKTYCKICGETEKISKIKTSYAFKLFIEELMSMGIWPKLKLKYKFEN